MAQRKSKRKVPKGQVWESSIHDLPSDSPQVEIWRTNQEKCPLFRLPAEIRLAIYTYVFSGPHSLYISYGGYSYTLIKSGPKRRLENKPLPGFHCIRYPPSQSLFTMRLSPTKLNPLRGFPLLNNISRDFYADTALLPYQCNTWAFHSPEIMRRFIVWQPQANIRAIRSLWAQNWYADGSEGKGGQVEIHRGFFKGLRVLWVDGPGEVVRHELGKAEGEGEGKDKGEVVQKSTPDVEWQMMHGNPPYDFL